MSEEEFQQEVEAEVLEPATLTKETPVIVNMPAGDAKIARGQALIRSMLEKKSIKQVERKEALIAEENINEVGLEAILSRDDLQYYNEKKEFYLRHYPELVDPFDQDDMYHMIIEDIFLRNLLKRKKKHPNADISKEWSDSSKRHGEFKKSLAMRRMDRNKSKDKKQVLNIANLSLNFSDKGKFSAMEERARAMEAEEQGLTDSGKVTE